MSRQSAPIAVPSTVRWIRSRDNAVLRQCRRLLRDASAYKDLGLVWVEGEHLCRALRDRAVRPPTALIAQTAWEGGGPLAALALDADETLVIQDEWFGQLSPLPSPAGLAFLARWMPPPAPDVAAAAVVLDRLQDAGNVGSILRSASAFGVRQVWALTGTASLWSPKVLRSGMGAHFGMSLLEGLELSDLPTGSTPWVAADARGGSPLTTTRLPQPCVWVFGHEGQGLSVQVAARCAQTVNIPQPGGEDSLNVAAAAAICLYESARQAVILRADRPGAGRGAAPPMAPC